MNSMDEYMNVEDLIVINIHIRYKIIYVMRRSAQKENSKSQKLKLYPISNA